MTRYYYPQFVPVRYCDLEDHQVTRYGDQDNGNGNGNNNGDPGGAQVALETPYDVAATSTGSSIQVTWQADNVAGTIYVVERLAGDGTSARYLAEGNSYTDTDVTTGISYTYRVYAYYEKTESTSDWSSYVSANL